MCKKEINNEIDEVTEEQPVNSEKNDSECDCDPDSECDPDTECDCEESLPEDKIQSLENEMKALNDKHLRLIAEYDNYRKRTLKEKIELSKTAGEKIFTDILPLVDDFERALQHIDTSIDLNAVKEGIELIYSKFINFLLQQGVKEIETAGKDFDAEIYDAVAKVPATNEEMKNKIIDCVAKGYMLDDKVIRYPKVVVGE